jgi:ribosomal protein S18 acetylase RimI-like enzyme
MKTPSIQIQMITEDNVYFLDNVLDDVFDYPIQTDYLTPFITSPIHHLVVAMNDSQTIVGFVSYVDLYHPDKATQVFVNELSVHEDYQRLGIGSTLMNHVFEYAKDHAYYVWVATEMDNVGADTFYQQLNPHSRQDSFFYDWKIKKDRS